MHSVRDFVGRVEDSVFLEICVTKQGAKSELQSCSKLLHIKVKFEVIFNFAWHIFFKRLISNLPSQVVGSTSELARQVLPLLAHSEGRTSL